MLGAIEGIDGAGKGTAAAGLRDWLAREGWPVRLVSFPRYQETAAGRIIGRLLGDGSVDIVQMSVEALATLFAEDRRQAHELLAPPPSQNGKPGVVVCDRFSASNAAFQCGRLPEELHAPFIAWLEDLEFVRFGIPRPDLNILLDVSPDVSRQLVAKKAQRAYTDQTHDANEADSALQERAAAAYRLMVETGAMGAWRRVEVAPGGTLRPIEAVLSDVIGAVAPLLP